MLPPDSRGLVSSQPISHSFAFGRDVRVASSSFIIPEWSNGHQRLLTVAVLEEQPDERRPIPLLLSHRWQQENGLVVDHQHDDVLVDCVRRPHPDPAFVTLCGRRVPLHIVETTGHHALQLLPTVMLTPTPTPSPISDVLVLSNADPPVSSDSDLASITAEVSRLHAVYGHPPSTRLVAVLRRAGVKDPAVLSAAETVAASCAVCCSHGRPEPRPRACIPLSLNGEFNLWVALDLSMFEGRWRLNIICLGTRFMRSRFVTSKSSAAIVGALENEWISFFGPMRNILTDVGGEFTGDEFRRYCEVNNIVLHTTAAEAQFANGIVERHGGLLSNVMARMRCDIPRAASDLLLAKALLVHNDTATVDGTSPLQRLIGRRAHLPSVLIDGPSAMAPTDGDLGPHVDHLSALHAARVAFAQAQASSSLKTALASRMYPSSRAVFHLDDKVYFYDAAGKSRTTGWRGPGTVTGFSSSAKMVTIHYGNQRYIRHMSKVRCSSDLDFAGHVRPTISDPVVNLIRNLLPGGYSPDDLDDNVAEGPPPGPPPDLVPAPENPGPDILPDAAVPLADEPKLPLHQQAVQDPVNADFMDIGNPTDGSEDDDAPLPQLPVPSTRTPAFLDPDIPLVRRSGRRGPPSRRLRESREGNDDANLITIIPDVSTNANVVFLSSREVPVSEQGPEFSTAKLKEISDIRAYGAVESIDAALLPPDAQIVDTRFICERRSGTMEAKARLVALGFQESVGTDAIDAPTVTRTGVRLLLAHAARRRWKTTCIDYKRAFLQARDRHPNDPVIAVVPPPEAQEPPGFVWVLRKSLYGLRSAPKEWWLTLLASLLGLGFTQSRHDPAVFIYREPTTSAIIGLLALHVDDMLAAGSADFDRVLDRCESVHRIGSKLHTDFVYLGVEIATDPMGNITLRQTAYIEAIKLVKLPQPDEELSSIILDSLNHVVGELMWVAASTRCDIAVDAATLISELHHPTLATVLLTNKLVRYLHHTRTQPLVLSSDVSSGPLEFKVYSDAALDHDSLNGKSRGGFLIAIGPQGGEGQPSLQLPFRMAVINWRSSLIQRVVTSSFSAELLNLCSCLDAGIWTRDLFAEMTDDILPIQAFVDCKSVVDCSTSLRLQATERRLTRYIWFLREALERVDVRPLQHIRSDQQVADGLTKRSPALRAALRDAMDGWGHRT